MQLNKSFLYVYDSLLLFRIKSWMHSNILCALVQGFLNITTKLNTKSDN